MSYLTLAKGVPDFSKAVISLWFRVPKESVVAAASSAVDSGVEGFTILQSILPLVTFGRRQYNKDYRANPEIDVGVLHYETAVPPPYFLAVAAYSEHEPYEVDPCLVGLTCRADGSFRLVFNIQMENTMSLSATTFVTSKVDLYDHSIFRPPPVPEGWIDNYTYATIHDVSNVDNEQPEVFTVESTKDLDPEKWHHLLLSFDVSGSISIGTPFASSSCRLWYAIDDIDYRGAEHLGPYRDTGGQWGADTLDPNAILTKNAHRLSGGDPNWQALNYFMGHYVGLPQGSYDGGEVPSNNSEMGLPASGRYVDGIFRCEMAELQMWTGVTLDTESVSNRRAFVDNDGKPVLPEGTEDDPRGPAEKLLGSKPIIVLHGNSNWQQGNNTGSLGIEINSAGEEVNLSAGQFKPTAKIEKFKPEPKLEETPTA